jgi:HEPN domain-containing protein
MPERLPPSDPREWLNRARSCLAIARCYEPEIYLEDLCFQAQQAAEKAIKAVFIARSLPLPYIHDLADLLLRLEKSGLFIPDSIKSASRLNPFAVHTRYPGFEFPVSADEYHEALALAESVVRWADTVIKDTISRISAFSLSWKEGNYLEDRHHCRGTAPVCQVRPGLA